MNAADPKPAAPPIDWAAGAPALFVLLWSTGFLGARFGLPYAPPLLFLTIRFIVVICLFLVIIRVTRATWPGPAKAAHNAVTGVMVHGGYLGGVFLSLDAGLPAGLSALLVGLQPVLTACLVGPLLGERISVRQWLGFGVGLLGVVLVLWDRAAPAAATAFVGFGWDAIAFSAVALLSITLGTLYQKRFGGGIDLRTGTFWQYCSALVLIGILSAILEPWTLQWTGEFVFALIWLCVVLSVGAVMLLMFLIRRGAASHVASYFYLVPPVTASLAWVLFDEALSPVALLGFAATAAGVWLVVRRKPA